MSDVQPRAFISYSWTSEDHKQRILDIAARLVGDGADVVFDRYALREGDDKFAFMERMTTDDSVTHVLMFCDKRYAEKANSRDGGVGHESQIISQELYNRIEQSKFIPIVCERNENGEMYLPVFSKSRIFVDFSSPELENANWEQLIRLLFNKPQHSKPALGRPPAYITEPSGAPSSPCRTRFEVLKQAVYAGKSNVVIYREDFLQSCLEHLRSISLRTRPEYEDALAVILDETQVLTEVRDHVVDWILLEFRGGDLAALVDDLVQLINDFREPKTDEQIKGPWKDHIVEARNVFIHELFLYSVACMLKRKAFPAVRDLLESRFLNPRWQYSDDRLGRFDVLYKASQALGQMRAENNSAYISPGGERMRRNATRADLPFIDIIQADLLAVLIAATNEPLHWYPQSAVYVGYQVLPMFVRWTQRRHFGELAAIVGVNTADELRTKAEASSQRLSFNQWNIYGDGQSFERAIHLKELGTQ
jgi:SEFIR domain